NGGDFSIRGKRNIRWILLEWGRKGQFFAVCEVPEAEPIRVVFVPPDRKHFAIPVESKVRWPERVLAFLGRRHWDLSAQFARLHVPQPESRCLLFPVERYPDQNLAVRCQARPKKG